MMTVLPIIIISRWSIGKYKEKNLEESKIEVKGTGQYEGLRLLLKNLIFIKSADNYVEVNYLEDGQIKKQLIRNKLSEVEKDLADLTRTHRSYLVNLSHFKQWKSGDRKLLLVLTHNLEVPVSQTFKTTIENLVNSATA